MELLTHQEYLDALIYLNGKLNSDRLSEWELDEISKIAYRIEQFRENQTLNSIDNNCKKSKDLFSKIK